jgi:hypothetical protein
VRIPKTREQWVLAAQGLAVGVSVALKYLAFHAVVNLENYHYANVTGVCNHLDPREGTEIAKERQDCLWANPRKSTLDAFFDGLVVGRHKDIDDRHINELNTENLRRRGAGGSWNNTKSPSTPTR